jgi:hypothetical protein
MLFYIKKLVNVEVFFLFKNQSNGNRKIMLPKARTTLGKKVFSTFE